MAGFAEDAPWIDAVDSVVFDAFVFDAFVATVFVPWAVCVDGDSVPETAIDCGFVRETVACDESLGWVSEIVDCCSKAANPSPWPRMPEIDTVGAALVLRVDCAAIASTAMISLFLIELADRTILSKHRANEENRRFPRSGWHRRRMGGRTGGAIIADRSMLPDGV
ncbi:hypothetical protein [Telmatospirillum sp.]|uniref:hypothetical protein n=1 Tax=Telmatospirillum sp. TaxID=2079197 RepID=UPI002843C0FE|nr:hypothetical protein [Telmatospirillum sp.]MDR3440785.1 hypothetical protein [Telmatospirillum sp.]